jgi:hypothetical protein
MFFQLNLKDFTIIQLTNFKSGKESKSSKEEDSFLKNQQKEIVSICER